MSWVLGWEPGTTRTTLEPGAAGTNLETWSRSQPDTGAKWEPGARSAGLGTRSTVAGLELR